MPGSTPQAPQSSTVNPWSTHGQRHRQWGNNEKQPTNDHKQYETIKNNDQTTQNNAISKAKWGFLGGVGHRMAISGREPDREITVILPGT